MREIKFRGKRVDNGEWVYGDLVSVFDGDTGNRSPNIVISYNHDTFDWIEVIPETVGQLHNGLSRKVGVEIYVGDTIVHDLEEGLGHPKVTGILSEVGFIEFDYAYYTNIRLRGNIHEHQK